jgi:CheY-like chemotaxis protein
VKAFRADERTASTKLIVVSDRADALDERAAIEAGADGLVEAPFSSLQLANAVTELLAEPVAAD